MKILSKRENVIFREITKFNFESWDNIYVTFLNILHNPDYEQILRSFENIFNQQLNTFVFNIQYLKRLL